MAQKKKKPVASIEPKMKKTLRQARHKVYKKEHYAAAAKGGLTKRDYKEAVPFSSEWKAKLDSARKKNPQMYLQQWAAMTKENAPFSKRRKLQF